MNAFQSLRSRSQIVLSLLVGFVPAMFGQSIIVNSGFEAGTSPWQFYSNGSARFATDVGGVGSAQAGHITIMTPGSNVQVYQVGFPVQANTQYTLTFRAYSNSGHDISVSLHKHSSPYTNFGFDQAFDLTTSWSSYSVQFTSAGFSGSTTDARLRFWIAPYDAAGDEYFFDDVILTAAGSSVGTPTITSQPGNQTVAAGQTATFVMSASGTAPLFYQWLKNNANISGATNPSYTTPLAGLSDNGSVFQCVVSNSVGSATTNQATLTVTSSPDPPQITSHPSNQSVSVGQSAMFTVAASGSMPFVYQWQKNNANIGGATSSLYTTPPVTLSDNSSTFRCIVSNTAGSATSNPATLSVTTSSSSQTPYLGSPFSIPGIIQVEDFDNGGEGIAYHDVDGDNQGGDYRTSVGVDIQSTSDVGGGYNIGYIRMGEWLEYTVNISSAGTYTIDARVASPGNGGTFHIEFDGVDKTGSMVVPNTGNWQGWQTISRTGVALNAGQQILRIMLDSDGFSGSVCNLNYITITSGGGSFSSPSITSQPVNQSVVVGQAATFNVGATGTAPLSYQWQKNNANVATATSASYTTPVATTSDNGSTFRCIVSNGVGSATSNPATLSVTTSSTSQTPYLGVPFAIPGTIQAEDFDDGGEGIAYHDLDAANQGGQYRTSDVDILTTGDVGGGNKIGWTKGGEWLEYTVNVSTAGTYTIDIRLASQGNGGTFHIEMNGENVTGPIVVPNTGSWESFQTVSKSGVALSAGQQVLRFSMDSDGTTTWFADFNYVTITSGGGSSTQPSITSQPGNQSVTVGQTATFNVVATGTAPLSYQWQKNNTNISGAAGSSYTTPATTSSDNGSAFRCIASNSVGSATSNTATLTVQTSSTTLSFAHHIIDSNNPRNPHDKAIGDINGDGFIDVLAASSSNFTEGLFWYKYPSWTKYSIHFGSFSTSMQVADIDGDGDLDAIIAKGDYYGYNVYVYVNPRPSGNPEIGSSWQEVYVGDGQTHDVEIGDLNNDGKLDIVVRAGTVTLFFQNTLTSWTKVSLATRQFEGTSLGDIDGDGDLDIAINGYWLENPLPAGNPATASWIERAVSSNWGTQLSVHVADVNGDGRKDILFAPSEYSGGLLAWYESTSPRTGPWTEHVIEANVGMFHTLKTADMDGDGDQDVVTAEMHQSSDPDEVSVYRNGGGGVSWSKLVVATTGSHNARVGDIGNDGDIDIVGANWNNDAPGGAPIEYWENLGGGGGSSLDQWTYIQADNSRGASIFGNGTFGLGFGDLTGDGYQDIASGHYFYRNPGGTMASAPWPRVTLPNNPQSGRSVDAFLLFDAEGTGVKNDILAQDLPSVTWLKANDAQGNSWTPTVVAQIPVTSHGNGRTVKSAHIIAANTKPDILLSGGDGTYLMQIPANPAGGNWPIMKITTSSNGEQKAIGIGDINRDGNLDIAVATGADQLEVDWWSNPGNGTNTWVRRIIGNTNASAKMIEVADVNGDGRLDVIVTEEARPASVYWFEAPADPANGTWIRHTVATGLEELDSMSGIDMNNDGKPDIIVGEIFGAQRVIVFENVNNGASWTSHVVGSGMESHNGARAADLDNDGRLDIVSIAYNSYGYLHVWRNDATAAVQSPGKTASSGNDTPSPRSTLSLPTKFVLHQNLPNPFNPSTTIQFGLPAASRVTLKVFNIVGQEIVTLVNEEKPAGTHQVVWNAQNAASGMYFCRIEAGTFVSVVKMIVMK